MKLQFDGKELEVQPLNLNQLSEIEDKFGSLCKQGDAIPIKLVRFIAYLIIHPQLPELTEEQVGAKLGVDSVREIVKVLNPASNVGSARPLQ